MASRGSSRRVLEWQGKTRPPAGGPGSHMTHVGFRSVDAFAFCLNARPQAKIQSLLSVWYLNSDPQMHTHTHTYTQIYVKINVFVVRFNDVCNYRVLGYVLYM